jgi:hypothetical protein
MLKKRSPILPATALVLALVVAGCNGGGDGDGGDNGGNAGNGSGQTADTFVAKVMQIIGSSPEDAEPVSIEAETVTQPENTEPVPIS